MNFKIYRSSAGSGKTFTLAKEYLKLAIASPALGGSFSPDYYKKILAVTFTNDAANEMKERILGYLAGFSKRKGYDEGMKKAILKEIASDFPQIQLSEEEFFRRTKRIHEHLLHNYSDFSVSTIDSFNNRVVQSFKKDLQLPYNYEIELDTTELREEATDKLQNQIRAGRDSALNDLLIEFALNKADEGKNWYINRDLEDFANNLFHEEKQEVIAQLSNLNLKDFKQAKNELFQYLKNIETQIQALGQQAIELIAQHQIDLDSFAYGLKGGGIGSYFKKHAELSEPLHKIPTGKRVVDTVEKNKWVKKGIDATEKTAIEFISGDLAQVYYDIEEIKTKELSNYILAHSLRKTIYLMATITELGKHVEEIKEDKKLVHISDFNRKINKIVEEEPVPYIYERMGERYMHILIDEFQDTSKMQWHNLIPLLANSLGFGMTNMVVGDAKQAIYRWRGGKAEMLVKLPDVPSAEPDSMITEQAEIFFSQADPQVLETNYRSRKNIINFNNEFFQTCRDWLATNYPDLAEYYLEVAQNENSKQGGHIQVELLEKKLKKADYELATFERIKNIIEDCTAQGYSKKDIAILTRTNPQGAFIAEQLLANDIPVISSESLLVANSTSIQFILDFLYLLNQPLAPLTKANLTLSIQNYAPSSKQPKAQIELIEKLKSIANETDLASFFDFIGQQFSLKLSYSDMKIATLYQKVETLIRTFQLNESPKQQTYIHKFLDFVLEFENRFGNDLDQFLSYWERKSNKLSVTTPSSSNAVRVMTIHKSKGLQFPIVILPFADWEIIPKAGSTLWTEWESSHSIAQRLPSIILTLNSDLEQTEFADTYLREKQASLLDAFNLLYVAFTRPESKLFTLSQKKSSKELRRISEILEHYLKLSSAQSETIDINYLDANLETQSTSISRSILYSDLEAPEFGGEKQTDFTVQSFGGNAFRHTVSQNRIKTKQDALSLITSSEDISKRNEARREGVLIHYALEQIKYASDIPKAINILLSEGLINQDEVVEMRQKLEQVVTLPEIKAYFTPKKGMQVENEKEIIIGYQKGVVRKIRPDRLIIHADQSATIIDYKTGIEDLGKHKQQVTQYANSLQKIGYQKVESILVYTNIPKCEVVV